MDSRASRRLGPCEADRDQSPSRNARGFDRSSSDVVAAAVWGGLVAGQPHPRSRVGNPVLVQGWVPYLELR